MLAAQETTSNYFVRQSETGEQTIVQRLFWPVDENAARYEVVVERGNDGDGFTEIHRESAKGGYIDISLGPGRYRYQVRVFNLINQADYTTNWASFNIILALQPKIVSYTPESFYIYEDYRWELAVTGNNLVEDGAAFLVSLASPDLPLEVRQYVPSGETARLVFDAGDLRPGSYRIIVRNPGGLEAGSGPVHIDTFRPYDLEFSAGYAPLPPLYGHLFNTFKDFAPLGADLRGSFVFFKRPWGFFGVESNLYLNYLSAGENTPKVSAFITGGALSVLYRKILPWREFVFDARLGAGIDAAPLHLVFDYPYYKSEPITDWVPRLNVGLSLAWRFSARLYAEFGADYAHIFSLETPQIGYLRPFLNLGWRHLPR
jgi:hypothetical protein